MVNSFRGRELGSVLEMASEDSDALASSTYAVVQ
jgi:hypothetical protein